LNQLSKVGLQKVHHTVGEKKKKNTSGKNVIEQEVGNRAGKTAEKIQAHRGGKK